MTAGYRADGQRAWKQTASGTTYYFYDGDKLLYETNAAGTITAQNTWGETGLLARQSGGRTLLYTWDAQGNVSQQIDASTGNIIASYMFDAFGTRGANSSDPTAPYDPYSGFGGSAGYYADWETGLLLLGHRYYDPQTGRFLTRDPIHYAGGLNLYECVGNSPLEMQDSSGLKWSWMHFGDGATSGAIGGAFECLSTWYKQSLIYLTGSPPCDGQATCQQNFNCLIDMIGETACTGIVTGLTEGCEPCAGCICGAIEGAAHYFVDYFCAKAHPCGEPKKFNPYCLFLSTEAGCISGCLGGLFGAAGEGIGAKIGSGLWSLFGGGLIDANVDQQCDKLN